MHFPQIRSSEVRTHSPLTIKTSIPYESNARTLNASPRHTSISPVQRHSPSNAYISTATHRIGSPVTTLNKVSKHNCFNVFNYSICFLITPTIKDTSNFLHIQIYTFSSFLGFTDGNSFVSTEFNKLFKCLKISFLESKNKRELA